MAALQLFVLFVFAAIPYLRIPTSKMAVPMRQLCCAAVRQCWSRSLYLSAAAQAGSQWRVQHGLARSGSEYGPLTDLPDWSFADGRPAPPLKGQERRKGEREKFARRVVSLSSEVDRGMERWRERKEDEKAREEKKMSLQLKPKGRHLLTAKTK
ncbi:hypothetical protein AGOR_G00187130 [Albula goreensis]|uniref:Large ribosomal subunit protein mL52 n=1 Tax=Albula goreensis TaxID=1534307 RepID=A0A8T3CY11_9TELE|nr:hypothetical protein AGOR_G00187130 [Albula goreensis]